MKPGKKPMIPSPVLIGSVGQFHKHGTDDSSNLSPFIKKQADPGDGGRGVDGGGRGGEGGRGARRETSGALPCEIRT